MTSPGVAAVLLAAGSGTRMGADGNKVLLALGGEPILVHALRTLLGLPLIDTVVVVVRPEDRAAVADLLAPLLNDRELLLVDGGATRHDSETRALAALRPAIDSGELGVVAIHDTARPLASADLWRRVIAAAQDHGGAVPLVEVAGLLHRDLRPVEGSVGAVQTPQAFSARPLLAAYDAAAAAGFTGTDTAACLERFTDLAIVAIPGDPTNVKVTYPADLPRAERLRS